MRISISFGRDKEKKKHRQHAPRALRSNQYAAAKIDRLTAGWMGMTGTADQATAISLTRLRSRSRALANDNDYMKRFFKLVRSNVVGPQGIGVQVRAVDRKSKDEIVFDDVANDLIEEGWYEWAKVQTCTVDGRLSWIDVQQLIIETTAKDGEVLVREIKGRNAGNDYGYALQLISADHLDEGHNAVLQNGNRIRMGIEFNEWNRPVAYHVLTRHPSDTYAIGINAGRQQYERIPASEIIHLFITENVAQTRGVPWAHTAMRRLKMLGGYEENELVAASVGASKMGFFKPGEDGTPYEGSGEDEQGPITEAEPGIFETLPAGMDFVPWDPQHPSTAFNSFVKAMLRGVASGLGISYPTLANDLEGVNFSSIRQGALEERELWKMLQTWMIEHLCARVFTNWLMMAMTTQKIPLPLAKFEKFNKPIWRPRGWTWIDPLKEVNSQKAAMDAKIRSAQDVASEQGQDIEEVYAQLAREKRLRDKYGLTDMPAGSSAQAGTIVTEDAGDDEQNANE